MFQAYSLYDIVSRYLMEQLSQTHRSLKANMFCICMSAVQELLLNVSHFSIIEINQSKIDAVIPDCYIWVSMHHLAVPRKDLENFVSFRGFRLTVTSVG